MRDVPLFDSLTHPTRDGSWLDGKVTSNTVGNLLAEMTASDVRWAFAVGMKGVGGYDEDTFLRLVAEGNGQLFPVAWFDVVETDSGTATSEALNRLKHSGYVGIKLHPRLGVFSLRSQKLRMVIAAAHEAGLVVLLCSYFYGPDCVACGARFEDLPALLAEIPADCRLVLLHGGTTRLLELSEMTRAYPRVLLDLSFTLCRYEGSSLDSDMSFLFRAYDRRLCVGSDSPQYRLADLRRRFNSLSIGLPLQKVENVAYRNLFSLLEVRS